MASVKNLKKDINYVLGDIIEAVYVWELTNSQKDVENKKQHFKAINAELETKASKLIEKVNKL